MVNDWNVLARQVALIVVPLVLVLFKVPEPFASLLSGPMIEILTTCLVIGGVALVGWVIRIGQRREKPAVKIEEVAQLPEVKKIEVADFKLAAEVPSRKVTM